MAPSQSPKSTASKTKKEKLFHPASRKAEQLARKALRKGKLGNLASKRFQKHDTRGESLVSRHPCRVADLQVPVDFYGFFFHALPEGVLTLDELHSLIRDVWLTRHDGELEQERSARRKGRPKSVKETKLEDMKLIEAEAYRTGMGMTMTICMITHVCPDRYPFRGSRLDASYECGAFSSVGPERACICPTAAAYPRIQSTASGRGHFTTRKTSTPENWQWSTGKHVHRHSIITNDSMSSLLIFQRDIWTKR